VPVASKAASTISSSSSACSVRAQGRRPISTTSRTKKEKATLTSCSITDRMRESSFTDVDCGSMSPNCTVPLLRGKSPARADKRVDFPEPSGPISPLTVTVLAVKETLSTIRFPSISMETSVTFSIILYTCSLFHHAAQQDEKCGAADECGQNANW